MIHSFCEDCIGDSWAHITGNPTCPICRKTVDGTTKMDMEMMQIMSVKSAPCLRCKKNVSVVVCFDNGTLPSCNFISVHLIIKPLFTHRKINLQARCYNSLSNQCASKCSQQRLQGGFFNSGHQWKRSLRF